MQMIDIATTCPFCKAEQTVTVDAVSYANWQMGDLIQVAFPSLTPSEREALMTGICDTCFPSDDDVDDDEVIDYDDLTEAHHQALLDEYEETA